MLLKTRQGFPFCFRKFLGPSVRLVRRDSYVDCTEAAAQVWHVGDLPEESAMAERF